MVYFVIVYNKYTKDVSSRVFDTKAEALKFISDNRLIDKKYHEQNNWFYKLLEFNLR